MIELKPIGIVKSAVKDRRDMPVEGAPARIKVLPRYVRALKGIERCSHIWALCWFDKADRKVLRARPRKVSSTLAERGVFAMRSPDRPNPVALTCARLLHARGATLELEALDAVDGTPVLDIKPYSVGIDCIPSAAKPDFARKYRLASDRFLAHTLARTAKNFSGKMGRGEMQAAALAFKYARLTGRAPEAGADRISSNLAGGGADALCALFSLKPSRPLNVCVCSSPAVWVLRGKTSARVSLSEKDLRQFRSLLNKTR